MKQSEMQSLVDNIAKERKRHLQSIESVTIRDLNDMVGSSQTTS